MSKIKKLFVDKYDKNKYIVEYNDYILAKGGDGTLLRAINLYKDKKKPFFGFASGSLNFLMNKNEKILKNASSVNFNMIKVEAYYFEKNMILKKEFQAFNDVMLGGDMNSWIDFDIQDKEEIIGKFKGGGVIISTAQGSTGINKNNNGIILPLNSNNWVITGDKTNRKILYQIVPTKTEIHCSSRTNITLWVDGQNNIIHNIQKIIISRGNKVSVIFNNLKKFKKKRKI